MKKLDKPQKSFLKRFVPASAFIGGLCCFTPIVLVLLGISTVSFGASLTNVLYGTYKWAFRSVALAFLFAALFWYFYKKEKICTINQLKKQKNKVINFAIIALISGVVVYIVWLYVIIEIIGIFMGLWG